MQSPGESSSTVYREEGGREGGRRGREGERGGGGEGGRGEGGREGQNALTHFPTQEEEESELTRGKVEDSRSERWSSLGWAGRGGQASGVQVGVVTASSMRLFTDRTSH